MKSPEKVEKYIVNWLRSYAENSQIKGFVVGVSGGIDSAVTSTLCALTGLPVLALEMPIHQEKKQQSRAEEHLQWLNNKFSQVTPINMPLSTVFDAFTKMLPKTDLESQQKLSLANTRARFRMATLYYFAALHRYLVVGTGNKVEDFGVGFYTKYGDGGVDISPIADLLKTEVFELAAHLGIAKSIQTAAPTDGLWDDGRTDEDQLGATYPEMEWAMQAVEKKQVEARMSERQKKVLALYQKHHKSNRHKMDPIPVCHIPGDL